MKSSVSSALAAPALARANTPRRSADATARLFYDERFAKARMLANRLAARDATSAALTPVNGDISTLWVEELSRASTRGALILRGVTTESFFFCLKTLLQPHGLTVARIERVSRDLHAWEIHAGATAKEGLV